MAFPRLTALLLALPLVASAGCDATPPKDSSPPAEPLEGANAVQDEAPGPDRETAELDRETAEPDRELAKEGVEDDPTDDDTPAAGETRAKLVLSAKAGVARAKLQRNRPNGKARFAKVKTAVKRHTQDLRKSRKRLLRFVGRAHKAAEAGRHTDAIEQYRQALRIAPAEAGILAELSASARAVGDLDLAAVSTRKALDLTWSRPKQAERYAALGVIEEQRGNPHGARVAYERAIAARNPDKELRTRLAALDLGGEVVPPSSAEDLCDVVMVTWSCFDDEEDIEALPDAEEEMAAVCECEVEREIEEGTGESHLLAAAYLHLTGSPATGGSIDLGYLALKTRGHGWQLVSVITDAGNVGANRVTNESNLQTLAFNETLESRPGQELTVKVINSRIGLGLAANTLAFEDADDVYLCHSDVKRATCIRVPVARNAVTESLLPGADMDPDFEPSSLRWRTQLAFQNERSVLKVTEGRKQMPTEFNRLVGSKPLRVLSRNPGVDLWTFP